MHRTPKPDPAPEAASSAQRRPWTLLVLLCVAQFMVILDVTVVNVALPSIGRELGFAPKDLQWVVTTDGDRRRCSAFMRDVLEQAFMLSTIP